MYEKKEVSLSVDLGNNHCKLLQKRFVDGD